MSSHQLVREARDFLLAHREDYATAYAGFTWPEVETFNFADDWFDVLAAEHPDRCALWVIDPDSEHRRTYAELRDASRRTARLLRDLGLRQGDRLLLLLGNCVPLWEVMLAAIRLGVVVIPATPQLGVNDLRDRIGRGDARLLVARTADAATLSELAVPLGIVGVGEDCPSAWVPYARAQRYDAASLPVVATRAADPLLLYFTSGTTAQPKLVEHTHLSYPIGHLSTLYWMGLQPGDVHLNISSPGWAKHAWSNLFTPWLAGATVVVDNSTRFDPVRLLEVLARTGATTFCAPPTAWRMLVQTDLTAQRVRVREALSAGEPLNPEVIDQVRRAWGITVRDGYGQTETTAQVGNPPGQPVRPGSMGRPLPGYRIRLVDPATGQTAESEGELCLELDPPPAALMTGYHDTADQPDVDLDAIAFAGGVYHTGDVVSRDDEGYLTYVGRADDVFKASDYRISPFELESVLMEHPAVAEAAVVPAPDPIRLAVPKAYVLLAAGHAPDAETARSILGHAREHLAPFKRVRRLEFADLPKTVSGKIRRVDLRVDEADRVSRCEGEFRDSDFTW